jgi:uncharacterized protein YjeT (DUF2065 family)
MMHSLLVAVGLVFVLEGLLPFLAPHFWRQVMQQMLMQSDKTLRTFGLASMLIGLGLVYIFR